jgi:hypothetical protein
LPTTESTTERTGIVLDGEFAIASRWPISNQKANITPAGAKPVMAALVD